MKYLNWIIRVVLFIVVLLFAIKNTEPLKVYFFVDTLSKEVPAVVVMLICFICGSMASFLLSLPSLIQRRREISSLRRQVADLKDKLKEPDTTEPVPEMIVPMHPL